MRIKSHPLVSIITPAFNAEKTIHRCLQSVQKQTLYDWEHIVVNDGSTDATAERLNKFELGAQGLRILTSQKNLGAATARNAGIAKARGRYIAFIDADDEWLPRKLETQISFMMDNNSKISYGSYFINTTKGNQINSVVFSAPPKINYEALLRGCPLGCLTVAYDRESLGVRFMPPVRRGQDWALWLDLAREVGYIEAYPGIHAIYHKALTSLSSNKVRKLADIWSVYRHHQKLDRKKSLFNLSNHVFYRLLIRRSYINTDKTKPISD